MNKGQIKKFLSPDKSKLALLILFALVNIALIYTGNRIAPEALPIGGGTEYYGVPLPFYTKFAGCSVPEYRHEEYERCLEATKGTLLALPLILNMILGYLISCLVVSAYSKMRHGK